MATSDVAICNLALQKLGESRITDLVEDSPAARECNACYVAMRELELRKHRWSFAIKRAQLAADTPAPTFGATNSFTLPSDFLRLIEPDPQANYNTLDWRIEGRKIFTDFTAPLEIRYIYRVTDPNEFDASFVEVLACRLAIQMCEKITQSASKKEDVKGQYREAITEARRVNAIESISAEPPLDTWDTARL